MPPSTSLLSYHKDYVIGYVIDYVIGGVRNHLDGGKPLALRCSSCFDGAQEGLQVGIALRLALVIEGTSNDGL